MKKGKPAGSEALDLFMQPDPPKVRKGAMIGRKKPNKEEKTEAEKLRLWLIANGPTKALAEIIKYCADCEKDCQEDRLFSSQGVWIEARAKLEKVQEWAIQYVELL